MQTVSNKSKDFGGQNIYVGMDVHDKSWKVHIYSDEFELKSFSQEPSVDRLCNHLQDHYKGANFLLGYESGFCGFWIHRAFKERGIDCRVVHAADVPTNNKEQLRKTDKVDSKKIAKGLRNGDLNFIHVPDVQLELDRQLIRSRLALTKDATRIKNRIKALLKLHGIDVPVKHRSSKWSKQLITWIGCVDFKSVSGNIAMQTQLGELVFLEEQKKKVDVAIKTLSNTEAYLKGLRLLQSIPSIGAFTAMILLTELGDIHRFKRFDDLCSYCGLAPNCHNSGESEISQGLSRRGNPFVKNVLIECAWVAVRKDPALLLYYKQQIRHMKGQRAIIKVTRKLLSRIRYVMINEKEYEMGIIK